MASTGTGFQFNFQVDPNLDQMAPREFQEEIINNTRAWSQKMVAIVAWIQSPPYRRTYPKTMKNNRNQFKKQVASYIFDPITHVLTKTVVGTDKVPREVEVILDMRRQNDLIRAAHEGIGSTQMSHASAGHFGRDKCFFTLHTKYTFPMMRKRIQYFIKTCDRCQRVNTHRLGKADDRMVPIPVKPQFFQQFGIDLIGPLTPSNGQRYVITAVCYFTKWMEIDTLAEKSGNAVAWFLYKHIFSRYGRPSDIISDQGREFNNEIVKSLLEITGTKHRLTAAYHPQSNGLVERQNRTTQEILKKVMEKSDDWVAIVPAIMWACNSTYKPSTGYSPYRLVFQQDPDIEVELRQDDENQDEGQQRAQQYPFRFVYKTVQECMANADGGLHSTNQSPNSNTNSSMSTLPDIPSDDSRPNMQPPSPSTSHASSQDHRSTSSDERYSARYSDPPPLLNSSIENSSGRSSGGNSKRSSPSSLCSRDEGSTTPKRQRTSRQSSQEDAEISNCESLEAEVPDTTSQSHPMDPEIQNLMDEIHASRTSQRSTSYAHASSSIKTAQAHQKKHYDIRNKSNRIFEENQKVLKRNMVEKKSLSKLKHDKYLGPYRIVKQNQYGNYILRDKHNKVLKKPVPPKQLVEYYDRMPPSSDNDKSDTCRRIRPHNLASPPKITSSPSSPISSGQVVMMQKEDEDAPEDHSVDVVTVPNSSSISYDDTNSTIFLSSPRNSTSDATDSTSRTQTNDPGPRTSTPVDGTQPNPPPTFADALEHLSPNVSPRPNTPLKSSVSPQCHLTDDDTATPTLGPNSVEMNVTDSKRHKDTKASLEQDVQTIGGQDSLFSPINQNSENKMEDKPVSSPCGSDDADNEIAYILSTKTGFEYKESPPSIAPSEPCADPKTDTSIDNSRDVSIESVPPETVSLNVGPHKWDHFKDFSKYVDGHLNRSNATVSHPTKSAFVSILTPPFDVDTAMERNPLAKSGSQDQKPVPNNAHPEDEDYSDEIIIREEKPGAAAANHNDNNLPLVIHELEPVDFMPFSPLMLEDRIACAKAFGIDLPMDKQCNLTFTGIGVDLMPLNRRPVKPKVFWEAKPDGACFYNSLSILLFGEDRFSYWLRYAVCNYIIDPKNSDFMKAHIPAKYNYCGRNYVTDARARSPFVWATDVEIWATAQLSGYDIIVYHGGKWLRHSHRRARNGRHVRSPRALYLDNRSGNHFNPVTRIK